MLQSMTSAKRVRFRSNQRKDDFIKDLRGRVNEYFERTGKSQYANTEMYIKTVVAVTAWIATYAVIVSDVLSGSFWTLAAGYTFLGYVNIFIAFNIMHDATHEAYSADKRVNKILGYSMDFIGGNQYLFRRMHGAHHGYVNIKGIDVTMESHGMFRFTPDEPWKPFHRYQHYYTFVLYALAMIHWVLVKDFKWMFGEAHIGNQKNIQHPKSEMITLVIGKAVYYGLTLIIPLFVLSAAWWQVLLAWVILHIMPGLTFALMFQVTHVYDGTTYPKPDDAGNIENNYALHVVETTADFSRHNKFGTWLMGGINIHVMHHILPTVCHVHYAELTDILVATCEDHGIEYQHNESFWIALKKHYKILKHLSHEDATVPRIGKSALLV